MGRHCGWKGLTQLLKSGEAESQIPHIRTHTDFNEREKQPTWNPKNGDLGTPKRKRITIQPKSSHRTHPHQAGRGKSFTFRRLEFGGGVENGRGGQACRLISLYGNKRERSVKGIEDKTIQIHHTSIVNNSDTNNAQAHGADHTKASECEWRRGQTASNGADDRHKERSHILCRGHHN